MPLDVVEEEEEAEAVVELGEAEAEEPVWAVVAEGEAILGEAVEHAPVVEGADLRCPRVHPQVPRIWEALAPAQADPTWDKPTSTSRTSPGLPVPETIDPPWVAIATGPRAGFIPGVPPSPIFRIGLQLSLGQLDRDLGPADGQIPVCQIWEDNVQVEVETGPIWEVDPEQATDLTQGTDRVQATDLTQGTDRVLVTDLTRGTDRVLATYPV